MKTNTKTSTLTPARIAFYRNYQPLSIAEYIDALGSFLHHRERFKAAGHDPMISATERAWVQDAVAFAMTPAANADEARRKAATLHHTIDGWLRLASTAGEHGPSLAMIEVALKHDADCWGLAYASQTERPDRDGGDGVNDGAMQPLVVIEFGQLKLYASLTDPRTIDDAARRSEFYLGDVAQLRALGDEAALVSATAMAELALLALAGAAPSNAAGLKRKARCLAALRQQVQPANLVGLMIEAALAAEAQQLGR